jgi:hypothetical protein
MENKTAIKVLDAYLPLLRLFREPVDRFVTHANPQM